MNTASHKVIVLFCFVFVVLYSSCTKKEDDPASDATSVSIHSGDGQTGQPGEPLENNIEILVKDQYDNAFAETIVHFFATEGAVSSTSAQTDARGIASTSWTLGESTGEQILGITAFKTDGTTALSNSPLSVIANIKDDLQVADSLSLALVSGDNQTGMVGTILNDSIVIIVTDTNGNPFAGATLNILANDGSVSNSSLTTDANGLATINWTLGETVGEQTISVSSLRADGTTPLTGSPLTITANGTNVPVFADILILESGDNQTATVNTALANPVTVSVLDQFENPFPGATLTILVNDGSVSNSTLTTDANGIASINWTLGETVGEQTISVSSLRADGTTPLTGSPLTITANGTNVPVFADILILESGNNQTVTVNTALANPVTVSVLDQFENPFPGATVTILANDGSVSNSTLTTDANGLATINWTLGETVGEQTISVSSLRADGTTPLTGSPLTITANGTNVPVFAEILILESGNDQTATVNTALANPVVVSVLDQFENPFPGAAVSILVNDGSVSNSTLTTDANGLATINWTLGETVGEQTISISSLRADGTTPLTGSPLTITANGTNVPVFADILILESGNNQTATVNTALANPITVRVLDQFENPFAGATVNIQANNGSVSNTTLSSDANGSASTNWTLGNTVGTQTLTVTGVKADGSPLSGSPMTITATGNAALGADILFLQSGNNQSATVGTTLANPIVVRVLDQFENPFSGATVTILANDGSVSNSSITTDTNGNASLNWTLGNNTGTQTLTVTGVKADGTTPLEGSPMTITATGNAALGADILLLQSGNNQSATVGTALANPIVVRVLDQFENPFPGATVNMQANNGSVSNTTLTSDANGLASTNWTLGNTVGTQTFTVTSVKADGSPLSGSPMTLTATGNAALGADILLLQSGNNQSATVGTALANPIVVRILDQFENPFAGATVTILANDGSVSNSSITTDINGNASLNWTLGNNTGTQTLSITGVKADGTTPLEGSPMTITATGNAALGADILLLQSGNNQSATVGTALANPIVVLVLDQFENPFAGATVTIQANDGAVSNSSITTDANGIASINWTLGDTTGTQTLTVTGVKADGTTPLEGSPMTITATGNAALGADILILQSGDNQSANVGTALANPIVVRVLDQFENPFAGATVYIQADNGSVSNTTLISDVNGFASTNWTLGNTIGTQTLTVTGVKADGATPLSGSPMTVIATGNPALAIGDFHAGGVIFYLDNSGTSGLVCAVSNQSDFAAWGCSGTAILGAGGTTIGTGAQNTSAIISGCSESLIAAEWCSSLTLNGYSDWFLPSQDELNELFQHKATVDATAISNGGTALDVNRYWSSTQINENQAWGYNVFGDDFKTNSYAVRAVRAF